jgi:hypothetical protein
VFPNLLSAVQYEYQPFARHVKFHSCWQSSSVHYRTIQINHQPAATIFQFIILTSVYSSTWFGRFPANHQELNDCSGSHWFYLRIVVTVVLCSNHVKLYTIVRIMNWKIVASGWWFIWIKCKTPVPKVELPPLLRTDESYEIYWPWSRPLLSVNF